MLIPASSLTEFMHDRRQSTPAYIYKRSAGGRGDFE